MAIASSGSDKSGSFPKKFFNIYLIYGILDEPPTNTILEIFYFYLLIFSKAFFTGSNVLRNKSIHKDSNLARVTVIL